MKYRLIQSVDGMFIKSEATEDNLVPMMEVRGYELAGMNNNPRQREELQGQPKFKGVLGPMWDGDAIRYECQDTYETLSR